MVYAISDIHGADKAYFKLKDKVGFNANDEMYIIGDIFDGNTKNPAAVMSIIEDIQKNDNIHCLCGNHEIQHYNYQTTDNAEDKAMFYEYLVEPMCAGKPLLDYFKKNPDDCRKAMDFISELETSVLIKVRNMYFYLVHGSPVIYNPNEMHEYEWLMNTLSIRADFDVDLVSAVKSDPNETINKKYQADVNLYNLFAIVGHIPTKYYIEDNYEDKYQRLYIRNQIIDIDCGCRANSLGKAYNKDDLRSNLCLYNISRNEAIYYIE